MNIDLYDLFRGISPRPEQKPISIPTSDAVDEAERAREEAEIAEFWRSADESRFSRSAGSR